MSTIHKPRRLRHNTHSMDEPLGLGNPVSIDTAFKVLVRAILEYACAVRNPYLVKGHLCDRICAEESFASNLREWKGVHGKIRGVKMGFLRAEA